MGRKTLIAAITVAALTTISGGAFAASRYLITSTRQIKPGVLHSIETRIYTSNPKGALATMCPAGTDTTGQCEVGGSDARCPAGGFATGGGFDGGSNPPSSATIGYDQPDSDGRGWHVIMGNQSSLSATFQAVASCEAVIGGLAAQDIGTSRGSVQVQIAREVEKVRGALR